VGAAEGGERRQTNTHNLQRKLLFTEEIIIYVAKLIRRRRISLKRDNHPPIKNHACTLSERELSKACKVIMVLSYLQRKLLFTRA